LIESHQVIEDMVNGEDDVEIMDRQNPFLLGFQPLRLLKRPTLGTMAILSSLIVKLPILAYITPLHDAAHGRRAAIENCADSLMLLIRKPMRLFICANMLAEDFSHIVFHPGLWHWRIVVMRYVSQLHIYKSLLNIFVVFPAAVATPLFGIRLSKIDFRKMNLFAA